MSDLQELKAALVRVANEILVSEDPDHPFVADIEIVMEAARRVVEAKTFTTHWCEINGVPGNDCPDHERHHRREQQSPTGRCGNKTLLALDITEADNVRDLQDAIEDLGTDDFLVPHDLDNRFDSWLEVVDAARKYANGTEIRYCLWHERRAADDSGDEDSGAVVTGFCSSQDGSHDCVVETRLLAGITEDTTK